MILERINLDSDSDSKSRFSISALEMGSAWAKIHCKRRNYQVIFQGRPTVTVTVTVTVHVLYISIILTLHLFIRLDAVFL